MRSADYGSHISTAPLFLTWSVVNSVHWWSGSTQALPATTVLLLLCAWVLVGFPLTVIGGIVGKNRAGSFQAPCRTRNIPRQIPPQPWYKHAVVHMAIGGFLPFRWGLNLREDGTALEMFTFGYLLQIVSAMAFHKCSGLADAAPWIHTFLYVVTFYPVTSSCLLVSILYLNTMHHFKGDVNCWFKKSYKFTLLFLLFFF